MADSIMAEQRLTLAQAAKHVQIHVSTVWRWTLRGVRGVKLETALVGGQRYTSLEALDRFVARLNSGDGAPAAATPRQRQRQIDQAERELVEAGL